MILNSNRLRTFKDARLEIVTYAEEKFGLRIRDSKPSDTGTRGHSDPMGVDAVNSLSSKKGKGSSSPRDGCFKCGGAQRDCNARKVTASNRLAKANRGSLGPRVMAKTFPKLPNVPKVRSRVKPRKLLYPVLKIRNLRQVQKLKNLHRCIPPTILTRTVLDVMMTGVTMIGMLAGKKVGNKPVTIPQAHFPLGCFDFGVMNSPKRFDWWAKINLDSRVGVDTFLLNCGPDGAGDG